MLLDSGNIGCEKATNLIVRILKKQIHFYILNSVLSRKTKLITNCKNVDNIDNIEPDGIFYYNYLFDIINIYFYISLLKV